MKRKMKTTHICLVVEAITRNENYKTLREFKYNMLCHHLTTKILVVSLNAVYVMFFN